MTSNHGYNTPSKGTSDWDVPLNENFDKLDRDVEIRDVDANKGDYSPRDGAMFRATDTGAIYLGDGNSWVFADLEVDSLTAKKLNNRTTVRPGDSEDLKATVENAAPGETVYVPPGTYDVPSIGGDENGEIAWVTVPNDDVDIVGAGRQTVIKDENAYSDDVQNNERCTFYVNGVTGCTIRNLRFEGTYDGSSDTNSSGEHIIVRDGAHETTIDAVELHGGRSAVNIDGSDHCRFTNWKHVDGEHGFECGGKTGYGVPHDLTILNGRSKSEEYEVQRGLSIGAVDGLSVTDVVIENARSTGIRLSSNDDRIKDAKFTNVTINSPATRPYGIWIEIESNPIEDLRFNNCSVRQGDDAAIAVHFDADEMTSGVKFTNCLFETDDAPTWWTSNQPGGNTETNWVFNGCTFRTSVNGNGSRDGFQPEYLNETVFRDCTFNGSDTDLVIDGTMTGTRVICPHLENGTFDDNGTDTVRDDMS